MVLSFDHKIFFSFSIDIKRKMRLSVETQRECSQVNEGMSRGCQHFFQRSRGRGIGFQEEVVVIVTNLANKNIGSLVKFEFYMAVRNVLVPVCPMEYLEEYMSLW